MELRQLERFLSVVDEGTLAGAARTLGLTQQAISASVSGLEKALNVRLLDRAPGGKTSLTPYGSALVPHARSQLAADRRARDMLSAIADAQTGTVTIGIGETFAGSIVAEAVLELLRLRPAIRINLIEGYSEKLMQRFYKGEFDFVAVGVSGFTLNDGYHAESLYTANDVVACRPEHPLASKTDLTLGELEGYGWLVPYSRPSDVDAIVNAFVAEDCEPPTRFLGSDAFRIGMNLLASNDLLVMTSPALVANQAFGIEVLPIDRPTVRRNASLVLDSHRPLSPSATLMLENIRASALRLMPA